MRASHVIWNFQVNGIMLVSQRILLHMKQQKPYCKRCVLRNDTTIPPRSEAILPAHVVNGNLRMQHDVKHWCTIPFESVCGLRFIARTLISDECNKAKIRVCSSTERPLVLQKGLVISHLEKVDPLKCRHEQNRPCSLINTSTPLSKESIHRYLIRKKQEFAIFFENTPISSRRTNLIWDVRTLLSIASRLATNDPFGK